MNLSPNVDRLPFFLIQKILDYQPRLKKIPNYNIIRYHLQKKYCKVCGEYIDIESKKYSPRHIHLKYQLHYKYNKFDTYYIDYANPIHLFFFFRNEIEYSEYELLKKKKYMFKIIYKKKHINLFYSLRNILQNKHHKAVLQMNLIDLNLFKNREFFFEKDFLYLFPYLNKSDIKYNKMIFLKKSTNIFSLEHQVFETLNHNFEFFIFIYKIFYIDTYKDLLLYFLQNSNHQFDIKFNTIPSYFYISLLEYNYLFFEYCSDIILQKCILLYPSRMITLISKDIHYLFYIDLSVCVKKKLIQQ